MNSHMVTVETRKEPRAKFTRTPPAACSQHTTVGTRTWSLIPTLMENKQNFDGNQMTGRLQGIQGQGVRHRRRTQVRSIQLALSTRQAQEEAPDAPRHHQAPEPAGPLARAPARERAPRAAPRRAVHRNAGASASGGPRHRRPRRHWLLAGPSIPPRAPSGGGTGGSAAPAELARSRRARVAHGSRACAPRRGRDEPRGAGSHSPAGKDVPDVHRHGSPVGARALRLRALPSFTLCRLLALARFYCPTCPDAKIVSARLRLRCCVG